MKEQAEAKRIPRLLDATRPNHAVADHRVKTSASGLPITPLGPAGACLAVAILFLVAGFAVNVAFFVFAVFAAFGSIISYFPESTSTGENEVASSYRDANQDNLALFSMDSSEERSIQPGTPEYHSRWNS